MSTNPFQYLLDGTPGPSAGAPPVPKAPSGNGTNPFAYLLDEAQPEPVSHGLGSRALSALETATAPLGYLKQGVDWGARKVGQLQGLDLPEGMTTGQMIREAAGLSTDQAAGQTGNDTYGRRVAGRGIEFAGDIASDPLTYLLGGASKIGVAGKAAEGFIGARGIEAAAAAEKAIQAGKAADMVGRGAAAAFAPGMLLGAVHEGAGALDTVRREGFTPQAAEQSLGAILSGGMGIASAAHATGRSPLTLSRIEEAAALPTRNPFENALRPDQVAAERAMLTPDREAMANQQQASMARDFVQERPGAGIPGAIAEATAQPPAEPRLSSPDIRESQHLSTIVDTIPDVELPRREAFYRERGLGQTADLVQAERMRRAEARTVPEERTIVPERGTPEPAPVEPVAEVAEAGNPPEPAPAIQNPEFTDNLGDYQTGTVDGMHSLVQSAEANGRKVWKAPHGAMVAEGAIPGTRVISYADRRTGEPMAGAQINADGVVTDLAATNLGSPAAGRVILALAAEKARLDPRVPLSEQSRTALKNAVEATGIPIEDILNGKLDFGEILARRGERGLRSVPEAPGEPAGSGAGRAAGGSAREGGPVEPVGAERAAAVEPGRVHDAVAPRDLPDAQLADLAPPPAPGNPGASTGPKYSAAPNKQGFYSQLERVVEKLPQAMKGSDLSRYLLDSKRGVKAEEIKWTGLDDFLESRKDQKVTPQEVQEYLRQNAVEVKEVTKGEVKPSGRSVEEIDSDMDANLAALGDDPWESRPDLSKRHDELQSERIAAETEKNSAAGYIPSDTKFSKYQLPGGANYREVLLTLPEKRQPGKDHYIAKAGDNFGVYDGRQGIGEFETMAEAQEFLRKRFPGEDLSQQNFKSNHWDEPNILAHVRLNDRVDAEGKRVLFVEEVQSDWAQKGRREGFAKDTNGWTAKLLSAPDAGFTKWQVNDADGKRVTDIVGGNSESAIRKAAEGIPAAPFVGSTEGWTNLAMKRIIRMAAEQGYDRVAWTTGEQQNSRYDLSKHIDRLNYVKESDGRYSIDAEKDGRTVLVKNDVPESDLPDIIGKDVAERIVRGDGDPRRGRDVTKGARSLTGLDLSVGGEGMKGFYDQIIPQVAQKLGKKFGATVGRTTMPGVGDSTFSVRERRDGSWMVRRGEMAVKKFATEAEANEFVKRDAAGGAVHSMDITQQMRESVVKEGQPLFRAEAQPSTERPSPAQSLAHPLTIERVKTALPGFDFETRDGVHVARLKNGGELRVSPVCEIEVRDSGALARSAKAGGVEGEATPVGSYQRIGKDSIIQVAKEAPAGTEHHEGFHFIFDQALSEKERAAVLAKYGDEEKAAYAYQDWSPKVVNSWFSKIFQYAQRLYRSFRPTWESVFDETRSGRAAGRIAEERASSDIRYSTAPAQPPRTPKAGPQPVPGVERGPIQAEGRPMEPGEAPRVEAKVEKLRETERTAGVEPSELARDTVRSHEDVQAEANKILAKTDESVLWSRAQKGKLSDAEVMAVDALRERAVQSYETARESLTKARAEGGDTGAANARFLEAALDRAAKEAASRVRTDVNAGTALARALAARARVMKAGRETPDTFLRQVFREIEGVSDEQAAGLLRVMQDDPAHLSDALQAAIRPKGAAKWLELWKAGLVSAPGTQVANVLGNVGEQALRVGETVTAGLVDKLLGGERTRYTPEARAEMQGAMSRMGDAFGSLKSDLKDALTLAPEEIDLKAPLERQVGAIKGKPGRAVRIPFRLLGAFDNFFKAVGGDAELGKLAYRKAATELKGAGADKIRARAEQIRKEALDPESTKHVELVAEIAKARQSRTFQAEPGAMMTQLMQLRAKNPLFHIVMPFLQTPANIAKLSLERSPAGFIKAAKAYKAWRAAESALKPAAEIAKLRGEAVDAIARPLMGTALLAGFAAYAKTGGMTGSGPTDSKDRNALRDAGWQPYSFVVTGPGGKKSYVPYNRFEPVSTILGFAADMAEAKDGKSAGDFFDKALGSIVQNFTSKTYLQGLADAASVLNDPKQFASQYASNMVGSLVPNVVSKVAQSIDPKLRDTRAANSGLLGAGERLLKTVESRIPGASTLLPEKPSGTGRAAERQGNAVTRLLSPVQPSTESDDAPMQKLLVDLDAVPNPTARDITVKGQKVRLTDAEYEQFTKANQKATEYVRRISTSPTFKRLLAEDQRKTIRGAYDRERDKARERIFGSREFKRRVSA